MNLKAVVKYQLNDILKALCIYYVSFIVPFIFLSLTFIRIADSSVGIVDSTVGGMDGVSMIFIFIAGLNSFKKKFEFFQANSITRTEQHFGFIITVWFIAVGMALVDNIFAFVFSNFMTYHSAYYQFFGHANSSVTEGTFDLSFYFASFIWAVFAYAMFFTIGYFITLLYYKMNKVWKITVSVGVPTLLYGLSMIDNWVNGAKYSYWLNDIVGKALGVAQNSHNSYMSVLTTGLVTLAFMLINQLMIRKTVLK